MLWSAAAALPSPLPRVGSLDSEGSPLGPNAAALVAVEFEALPDGATGPDNLMCLCRRHHRIKRDPP